MRDHTRPLRQLTHSALLMGLLFLGVFLIGPAEAQARDREVVLRFIPPAESISQYRFFVANESTWRETSHLVDAPSVHSDGIARAVLTLDADSNLGVSMTAINAHGESTRSNSILIRREVCDPSLCDDGNPCTVDSCEFGGCFNDGLPDGAACDDGFVDTVDDMCVASECEGIVLACGRDLDCDDGNLCNGSEICDRGRVCLSGNALRCADSDPCMVGSCDPSQGCQQSPVPNGTSCDDGQVATVGDACFSGSCQGTQAEANTGLHVSSLSPRRLRPGSQTLKIRGGGFAGKTKIQLVNGTGKPPKLKRVRVVDSSTLEAEVYVGLKNSDSLWDLSITVKRVGQITMPDAVMVSNDGQVATVGDACSSGSCQGTQAEANTGLHVSSLTPTRLRPGWQTLKIRGGGFAGKTKIQLVNGTGKPPKLKSVRVVDSSTLEAEVYVGRKNSDSLWDLLIQVKKVGQITTPDAVTVSK